MIRRTYSFAGLDLQVELPGRRGYSEGDRLAQFRTEQSSNNPLIRLTLADALEAPVGEEIHNDGRVLVCKTPSSAICYYLTALGGWRFAFSQVEITDASVTVRLNGNAFSGHVTSKVVLNAIGAEHLIARAGGFIFHCSYIDVGGKAVLFTAPSGTGKSTQADLWQKYRNADIINGDRAAVRICDGIPTACGIPFAGSSQYCKNRDLPIAAIVYLSQAPETSIRPISGYEAFSRIWEGVSVNTWDKTDLELVSSAVQTLAAQVPVFHLCCTPDESAVLTLEAALRKLEIL